MAGKKRIPGSILPKMRRGPWTAERIEAESIPEPNTGCWLWLRGTTAYNYGAVTLYPKRPRVGAHVASYILHVGPIPAGMVVMHTCDNPPCVNPRHLRLGTHLDNVRDAVLKGRNRGGVKRRLTADEVRGIRRRHLAGEENHAIAKAVGRTPNTISQIVNRRTWRNVG